MTPNDELVAGPSGFQFIYGDKYNENNYEKWLETNQNGWKQPASILLACGIQLIKNVLGDICKLVACRAF